MEFQYEEYRIYSTNEEGKVIAEVTFPKSEDDSYVIDHTYVDNSLRGQGVAAQLVERAVHQIQGQGGSVKAICSYAVCWLEKNSIPYSALWRKAAGFKIRRYLLLLSGL